MTKRARSKPAAEIRQSKLEREFLFLWRKLAPHLPEPAGEFRFAPPRKWRFDFAWIASLVACELEGGTWSGGRHTRGSGYQADLEKYNHGVKGGWRILRYTADDLRKRPVQVIEEVAAMIESSKAGAR